MKRLLCMIGIHEWKWGECFNFEAEMKEYGKQWTETRTYQGATCPHCGIAKTRRVS